MALYLASRSPRRKELLEQAGINFRVYVPQEEEMIAPKTLRRLQPSGIVKKISAAKAHAAERELRAKGVRKGFILSADTLVFLGAKVLGKPRDKKEAKRMLKQLSGRSHQVVTGVTCVALGNEGRREKTIAVSSRVKFFALKNEWLDWYVATGEPLDKAGAYGAQGHGASFIESFTGSYTNVVGLPMGHTLALLEEVSGRKRSSFLGS